jgi:hypothetical protein
MSTDREYEQRQLPLMPDAPERAQKVARSSHVVGGVLVVQHDDGTYGLLFADQISDGAVNPLADDAHTFDIHMRVVKPEGVRAYKADFIAAPRFQGAYLRSGTYVVDTRPQHQRNTQPKVERARISARKKEHTRD